MVWAGVAGFGALRCFVKALCFVSLALYFISIIVIPAASSFFVLFY